MTRPTIIQPRTRIVQVNRAGRKIVDVISRGRQGVSALYSSPPINVWDYGAFGNDDPDLLVDETDEMQAALDAAVALRRPLHIPATNYLTSATLYSDGDVEIMGVGGIASIFRAPNTGSQIIRVGSSAIGAERALTADVAIGDRSVFFADTTGIEPGMMLGIRTNTEWPYDGRGEWEVGEQVEVASIVSATEVKLKSFIRNPYIVATDVPRANIRPLPRILLADLHCEFQEGAAGQACFLIQGGSPTLDRLSAKRGGLHGFDVQRCMHLHANDISAEHCGNGPIPPGGNVGYGMSVKATTNGLVKGLKTWACRRGIDMGGADSGGPAYDITVKDFWINGGGTAAYPEPNEPFYPDGDTPTYGVGGHGPAVNCNFLDGTILDTQIGVMVRGLDTTIDRVTFIGPAMEACIEFQHGDGLIVRNCVAYTSQGYEPLVANPAPGPDVFLQIGHGGWTGATPKGNRGLVVTNNTAYVGRSFVEWNEASPLRNVAIHDNTIISCSGSGTFYIIGRSAEGSSDGGVHQGRIGPNYFSRQQNPGGGAAGTWYQVDPALQIGEGTAQDDVVWTGAGEFVTLLADDAFKILRSGTFELLAGGSRRISIRTATASVYCDVLLKPDGTVQSMGALGAGVNFTNVSLTGTTGTDGKLTISYLGSGVAIENRMGAALLVRGSVVG